MAASVIQVNTSSLKSDVSAIDRELSGLREDVKQLRATANQLSSMWDGTAKAAFMSALADDISRLEELTGALDKFTRRNDTSRSNYDKCESAVGTIVKAIKV